MSGRQPRPLAHTDALPGPAVIAVAFVCGSVPFSNIAARLVRGVDLRDVGTGTVSGTALHEVAGFGPLAVAGVFDVAKGSVGPLLAGRQRPALAAAAGAVAVAGHNWSPFLRGAGGRGISPATGALLVSAPTGAAVLLGGLAAGRLARQTALVSLAADLALVPVARRLHGRRGGMAAAGVAGVIVAKRLAGNAPVPRDARWKTLRNRLLFDRD
jgi:acyl phosphate:glycerol-3-phosphate acyltransferase